MIGVDNFNYIHFLINKNEFCSLKHRDIYGAMWPGQIKGAEIFIYLKRR